MEPRGSCAWGNATVQGEALDVEYAVGEAYQDGCEGRASRGVRDIPDGGGVSEGVREDPTEASTKITAPYPWAA